MHDKQLRQLRQLRQFRQLRQLMQLRHDGILALELTMAWRVSGARFPEIEVVA